MTLEELKTTLSTSQIPVYYGFSKTDQKLPYMVYYEAYSNDFVADGKNYYGIKHIDLSLYTAKKDLTTESTVETILKNNGLVYTKTEEYSSDERVYQIIYEFEI